MAFPGSLPSYAGFTSSHTLAVDSHAAQHNQEQADLTALGAKVGTGASTPTSGVLLRGNGVGTSTWGQVNLSTDITGSLPVANAILVLAAVYPVGCIYAETTGTNPSVTFGFGSWSAYGAGRVLIGNGSSDQAFTAGATGGESNHTLTSNEMPSHTHTQDAHTHIQSAHNHVFSVRDTDDAGTDGLVRGTAAVAGTQLADTVAVNQNTTATNQNTGGGTSHNNLPPYQVIYYWTRTA